jgi:hypothetical protein
MSKDKLIKNNLLLYLFFELFWQSLFYRKTHLDTYNISSILHQSFIHEKGKLNHFDFD